MEVALIYVFVSSDLFVHSYSLSIEAYIIANPLKSLIKRRTRTNKKVKGDGCYMIHIFIGKGRNLGFISVFFLLFFSCIFIESQHRHRKLVICSCNLCFMSKKL